MSYCDCDYDGPFEVYRETRVNAARKCYRCSECRREIQPREPYERVFSVFDGMAQSYRTCQHCLRLRDFVSAHIPCFCWLHGDMRHEAIEMAISAAREAPGLLFGAYRREILIRRAAAASRKETKS